jgi:hypothetical protein
MTHTINLLTRNELADLLRISCRTLARRRAEGTLLDPIAGPGAPRWDFDEVVAWIRAGRPKAETWRAVRARKR